MVMEFKSRNHEGIGRAEQLSSLRERLSFAKQALVPLLSEAADLSLDEVGDALGDCLEALDDAIDLAAEAAEEE